MVSPGELHKNGIDETIMVTDERVRKEEHGTEKSSASGT